MSITTQRLLPEKAAVERETDNRKVLECILCYERFSERDILAGRFRMETYICSFCYARMQQMPHERSCFGKPTTVFPNGKKVLGYDTAAIECSKVCPDRVVCALIMNPSSIVTIGRET